MQVVGLQLEKLKHSPGKRRERKRRKNVTKQSYKKKTKSIKFGLKQKGFFKKNLVFKYKLPWGQEADGS